MNPYDILNVRKNASQKEITFSFNTLFDKYSAKNYSGDPYFAQKRLKDITEAYNLLSDPQKRKKYDSEHDTHINLHNKEKVNNNDVFTPYYKSPNTSEHIHNDYEIAQDKYNKYNSQTSNDDPISNKGLDYVNILDNPISDQYNSKSSEAVDNNDSKKLLSTICKFLIFIYILSFISSIANMIFDFISLF